MSNGSPINPFPSRRDISKNDYYNSLLDQVRSIDVEKLDYSNADFKPRSEIVEKQRVYFWIRAYLNEESNMSLDQDVTITYTSTGETLTTRFICFAKKGHQKDMDDDVVNYNPEDDKKVLCLMIDSDKINVDSDDIPFIRTLFRIGKYFQPQILRKNELLLKDSKGNQLEYYDIEF